MSNVKEIEVLGGRKIKAKDAETMAKQCLDDYDKKMEIKFDDYKKGETLSNLLFENSPHFYVNPTERLIMGNYIEENDNVVSVLGSGDFALDSIYHGSKNIVTFDINKYQYYVAMLKYLAINGLSYDDFFTFFCDIKSEDYLSPELY